MKEDSIALRDEELRRRLDEIVKAHKGRVSKSAIVRAALEELLTRIETKGIAAFLAPAPQQPDEPYSARDYLSTAGEHAIIKKDAKFPPGGKATDSPSRVRGK